jgi:hypothetical protein
VRTVVVREQHFDLPRIGRRIINGREWTVFELPGTSGNVASTEGLELGLLGVDGVHAPKLELHGGLPMRRDGSSDGDHSSTHLERCAERVHGAIGRHVDLVYRCSEDARPMRGGSARLVLAAFLAEWVEANSLDSPKVALIVKLAERADRLVADLAERPRRVLRRQREMQRVASARQIDPAGIRWLVRQPGQTLAERAGPRQRILAVTRHESVDTLENRVVRDFLDRSAVEAHHWLADNERHREHERWAIVRRYDALVRRLRRVSELRTVRPVHGSVEANYVLQHDSRYSIIWRYYQELRRRQEQEDEIWRWRHRYFAEFLRLGLMWALDRVESEHGLDGGSQRYERPLHLTSEHRHGEFVDAAAPLGGWIVACGGVNLALSLVAGADLRRFEERLRSTSRLYELGPDAVVALHDPFRLSPPRRMIAVWSRLNFDRAGDRASELRELARRTLETRGGIPTLAVLVEPSMSDDEGGRTVARERALGVTGDAQEVRLVELQVGSTSSREVLHEVLTGVVRDEVGR